MIGGYVTQYVTTLQELNEAINSLYPGIYCQRQFSDQENREWDFGDFLVEHSNGDYYSQGSLRRKSQSSSRRTGST
jgi:hypothetical protein